MSDQISTFSTVALPASCTSNQVSAAAWRPAQCAGSRPRCSLRPQRAGERLHEVLELLGGPALERLAVLLVGADHGVAVVPVQARLGVEPEGAAGLRRDLPEDVGARVAAVGARVAEDDDRRAGVE